MSLALLWEFQMKDLLSGWTNPLLWRKSLKIVPLKEIRNYVCIKNPCANYKHIKDSADAACIPFKCLEMMSYLSESSVIPTAGSCGSTRTPPTSPTSISSLRGGSSPWTYSATWLSGKFENYSLIFTSLGTVLLVRNYYHHFVFFKTTCILHHICKRISFIPSPGCTGLSHSRHNMSCCIFLKGTVRRDLRGVKGGINR